MTTYNWVALKDNVKLVRISWLKYRGVFESSTSVGAVENYLPKFRET